MTLLAISVLAISAGAAARASTPTATTSSTALRRAILLRNTDHRIFVRDSSRLSTCLRLHPSACNSDRHAARHARVRLTLAKRRVRILSAHVARRHRAKGIPTPPSAGDSGSGSGSGPGARNGMGTGGGSTESSGTDTGTGSSGSPLEGIGSSAGSNGESGSPATFGEPFVKGIVTNIQGWGTSAIPQIASEMSSLGVNWAREDLSWADVESTKGVFDWSGFDQLVSAAKAKGITILPIVGYAPSWTSPTDATGYAAFVKAAVTRYGPGTAANLKWWELWNEPYFAYAWSTKMPEPAAYARDALAAAQAAKGVSPSVKLLVSADYQDSTQAGGSTPWQTSWISDMFTAAPSLGHYVDGVSVHPYGDDPALKLDEPGGWQDNSREWAFQRIDTIHAKFLEHGVNVPFWITEEGWSTASVSEATQAQDYADLIPQIASRPWIRALFPYCLREFSASATDHESQFGLLKFGTWQPKPAFYALQKGLAALS